MVPVTIYAEKPQMEIIQPQLPAKGGCLLIELPFGPAVLVNGMTFHILPHHTVHGAVLHPGAGVHEHTAPQPGSRAHTFQGTGHIAGLYFRRINFLPVHPAPGKMEKCVCMANGRYAVLYVFQAAVHNFKIFMHKKGRPVFRTRAHQGVNNCPPLQEVPGQVAPDKSSGAGNDNPGAGGVRLYFSIRLFSIAWTHFSIRPHSIAWTHFSIRLHSIAWTHFSIRLFSIAWLHSNIRPHHIHRPPCNISIVHPDPYTSSR